MRVMIVTGSMKRGGAERVVSIVSNYYAGLGWDVCLVRCLFSEIEYELDKRIRTMDISNASANQMLDTPRLVHKMRILIKDEKPDAVLSFMVTINFVTALACKGLNVRFIPSERNDPEMGRTKFWQKAGAWAYGQSSTTVFQTSHAMKFFSPKVQSKSVIIPNPVIVKEFAGENKDKVIVTVGRLEKQKNQRMLIDAFSEFYRTHQEYRLRFFGRGSLESELREQVSNLGLTDAVDFMGNVNDVHHQIKNASLFVLTSDFEGLSNALIEAMMIGIPCISTDCAGADEIIDNGESGIIIKRGDIPALIEAMTKLIDDKKTAEEFANNAHKRILHRFDADIICRKWKEIVEG